jgi:outer membrane protein TolC
MKSKIFAISAIGLATLSLMTAHANPILPEITFALENNPQLLSSRHALSSAQTRAQAAEASRLPTINFSYDNGREKINSLPFATTDTVAGTPGTQFMAGQGANWMSSNENRYGMSISTQMPVYNGGRLTAQVEMANLDALAAKHNNEGTIQDIMLEAITVYLSVARAKTLIELSKQNEETTTKQLDLEMKRLEAGGGVKVDAMQAQTRLQIVRERAVYYNQMLREAVARYEQTFGHAPDMATVQDLDIYEAAIPATVVAAISLASESNPRLKAAMLQVERAQHQITVAQSARRPSVDVVGSVNRNNNTSQTYQKEEAALYLRASWAINMGGEFQKRELAAVTDSLEARSRADGTLSKVKESVRIAWNQVENGKERLQLLANAANISRNVMTDRKVLRDAGKETALAALDAEVEYFGVLSNKVNSLYDTRIGAYRLMAAMGKLSVEDIGVGADFKLPVKPLVINIDALAKMGNSIK